MKPTKPYAALETAALEDLATRTLADPEAPQEHVEAATARLAKPRGLKTRTADLERLSVEQLGALQRALADALID